MRAERINKLASFIKFLEDEGILKFNISNFWHRLRLQKYVFIAGFFGFKHDYNYNMYIKGPYSVELADDYYELSRRNILPEREIEFNKEKFVYFVRDRDSRWLEVAATVLSLMKKYKGSIPDEKLEDTIINLTKSIKPFASTKSIKEILTTFKELKNS